MAGYVRNLHPGHDLLKEEDKMAATGRTMNLKTTAETAGEFFAGLAERGREPLLQNVSGTLRFDLVDGERIEHWYLDIKNGRVAVSRKDAKADAVVRTAKDLFDGMAAGKVNAMAATLRGALALQGNYALFISFQRLFPGPAASREKAGSGSGETSAR
jgi:putative sterol carrier protein